MSKKKRRNTNTSSGLSAFLRKPAGQITAFAIVIIAIILIALSGQGNGGGVANEVNTDEAYQMYQNGAFVVDVRTQEEWNEYHAPNTTLIPLDELQARLAEVPKDREILVICRSGNRSQQGRDILLAAGYNATSMAGGLKEWYAKGYPTEGTPAP